ncbi:hypothetical protein, partial [Cellulomonas sp. P5_C6]
MAPEIPDEVVFSDLDRAVRGRLRTLSKDNAEGVGRHLVMVGMLLDTQPELAYEHAQAAVRRAGRVDVVREAAGLAAYRTERYAEALRELRTVRRLNGSSEHLAIMADCERGLGRPERALALAQEPEAETLDAEAKIELAIVVSGARLDLGQAEAAVAALATADVRAATGLVAVRVAQARATALEAAGRADEAAAELAPYTQDQLDEAAGNVEVEDDVVAFDLSEFDEDGEYDEDESDDDAPVDSAAAELDDEDESDDDAPVDSAAAELDDEDDEHHAPQDSAAAEVDGDAPADSVELESDAGTADDEVREDSLEVSSKDDTD